MHDMVQAHLGQAGGEAGELERMLADVRRELADGEDGAGEGEA